MIVEKNDKFSRRNLDANRVLIMQNHISMRCLGIVIFFVSNYVTDKILKCFKMTKRCI